MFGQTVNRCHATPIVILRPIVTNHAIEMMILIAETITMPVSSAGVEIPAGSRNQLNGKCSREVSVPRSRYSIARKAKTQRTIPSTVSST
jgi:hypothetical protein